MPLPNAPQIELTYGFNHSFSYELVSDRLGTAFRAPAGLADVATATRQALANPIDFPALEQSVLPDDNVSLVLDRDTPHAPQLIAEVWAVLQRRGLAPDQITIVQPASRTDEQLPDPRCDLPAAAQQEMGWKIHDASIEDDRTYLASSTGGERIYLSKEVANSDVTISIGPFCYDPILGYRGTHSVFYSGLSSDKDLQRVQGQDHSELTPDNVRPLRQLVDEVGWLLGTQFTLQVIPSAGTGAAAVLAGSTEGVYRQGISLLRDNWHLQLEQRPEIVVVGTVPPHGKDSWSQVGAAIATARRLVAHDGRIVILSDLDEDPTPGIASLRNHQYPADAVPELKAANCPDFMTATQIAQAADWASVYLMSELESDLVEDLFMIPLANHREVQRLLDGDDSCLFVESAPFVYGEIVAR